MAITKKPSTTRSLDDVGIQTRQVVGEYGYLDGFVDPKSLSINPKTAFAICALNFLQASTITHLPHEAIDQAIVFHFNFMQPHAKRYINYIGHQDYLQDLFTGIFENDEAKAEADFTQRNDALGAPTLPQTKQHAFFSAIRNHAYTLMPINVGNHWVSLILHQTTRNNISYIDHAVIADSSWDASLIQFVWQRRLQPILCPERGFKFTKTAPDSLWFPIQHDTVSCGLRTYDVLRTVMLRVSEAAVAGVPDAYHPSVFSPLSGDFQPDKIRAEMIGNVAYEAMRHQNFDLRIMLAPFEKIKEPVLHTRPLVRGCPEVSLLQPDRFHDFPIQEPPYAAVDNATHCMVNTANLEQSPDVEMTENGYIW